MHAIASVDDGNVDFCVTRKITKSAFYFDHFAYARINYPLAELDCYIIIIIIFQIYLYICIYIHLFICRINILQIVLFDTAHTCKCGQWYFSALQLLCSQSSRFMRVYFVLFARFEFRHAASKNIYNVICLRHI